VLLLLELFLLSIEALYRGDNPKSEAVNLLGQKVFGGNITFKIDISKAFDTIEWTLLVVSVNAFAIGFTLS